MKTTTTKQKYSKKQADKLASSWIKVLPPSIQFDDLRTALQCGSITISDLKKLVGAPEFKITTDKK